MRRVPILLDDPGKRVALWIAGRRSRDRQLWLLGTVGGLVAMLGTLMPWDRYRAWDETPMNPGYVLTFAAAGSLSSLVCGVSLERDWFRLAHVFAKVPLAPFGAAVVLTAFHLEGSPYGGLVPGICLSLLGSVLGLTMALCLWTRCPRRRLPTMPPLSIWD